VAEAKTMTDAQGVQVAVKYVPVYDRTRDRIARNIYARWTEEERRLKALKEWTFEQVMRLQAAAAAAAGAPELGGKEGYIQFRSFDGSITVRVDNAKKTEFDERLALAQALIHEAIRELANSSEAADLIEIATRAFEPRASGSLDMQRIRDLRKYRVSHPKWKQAVEIIGECERVVGHRRYVRVQKRDQADAAPRPVILDIAAV